REARAASSIAHEGIVEVLDLDQTEEGIPFLVMEHVEGETLAARLEREAGVSVGVVNARFVKPLDRNLLLSQAAVVPLIVTLEDHVLAGGFGSAVLEALQEAHCPTAVERIGWPDKFVEHGSSVEILRASYGLAPDDIFQRVSDRWRGLQTGQKATADL
ncbi:MAG TPA: transketolase C-terminal domain-containing protein, partial [Lacunisphaera sp.]|nr:transketolase C-terminal domain-containing protein [Lacunisphaera sp.]